MKGYFEMEKMKVAIVGCGGIANNKHLPSLMQVENVEIVAFCDIVEERAVKSKEEYGTADARVYTDYKEMLKNETDLTSVHVCTPNNAHCEVTCASLEAGAHVLCEKPMAKTVEDARKMLETSKKTGKLLTIGYQNRFRQDSTHLKRAVDRGDLGEIYYAKGEALRRRAVPTWGVFLDAEAQGGGPLIDIGTHALDLTLWLMGNYKVKDVKGVTYRKLADQTETGNAWGDWDPSEFTVEDSAFGFITMENGASIVLESSWALNVADPREAQCVLCGTKAGADFHDGLRINKVEFGNLVMEKPQLGAAGVAFFDGEEEKPQVLEAKCFYSAIEHGTELVVKPEQALVVTEVLDAMYRSAQTGKLIEL